jgi:hypothetical protein
MSQFRKHLEQIGIAESRHFNLNMAFSDMHSALCKLDKGNLAIIRNEFPGLVESISKYASSDEGLNPLK